MKECELLRLLHLLQGARNKLVSDFIGGSPDIFIPIYKYEDNENMMNLHVEYYFLEWVNYHFSLFVESHDASSPLYLLFIKTMLSLIGRHVTSEKDGAPNEHFPAFDLLKEKQRFLSKVIEADDRSEVNFRKLLHFSSKDKALFNRKFAFYKERKQ